MSNIQWMKMIFFSALIGAVVLIAVDSYCRYQELETLKQIYEED